MIFVTNTAKFADLLGSNNFSAHRSPTNSGKRERFITIVETQGRPKGKSVTSHSHIAKYSAVAHTQTEGWLAYSTQIMYNLNQVYHTSNNWDYSREADS